MTKKLLLMFSFLKVIINKTTQMEYLPEKKRTQQTQILKHERKIHAFREYLCDSEVVLAIVKCKSQTMQ